MVIKAAFGQMFSIKERGKARALTGKDRRYERFRLSRSIRLNMASAITIMITVMASDVVSSNMTKVKSCISL